MNLFVKPIYKCVHDPLSPQQLPFHRLLRSLLLSFVFFYLNGLLCLIMLLVRIFCFYCQIAPTCSIQIIHSFIVCARPPFLPIHHDHCPSTHLNWISSCHNYSAAIKLNKKRKTKAHQHTTNNKWRRICSIWRWLRAVTPVLCIYLHLYLSIYTSLIKRNQTTHTQKEQLYFYFYYQLKRTLFSNQPVGWWFYRCCWWLTHAINQLFYPPIYARPVAIKAPPP